MFVAPEIEVVKFAVEDVITTSTTNAPSKPTEVTTPDDEEGFE